MSRVRLTNKVIAAMEGKDVYNMNVPERKDPGQKYQDSNEGPSTWAEDPAKPDWKGQKRDEMNVGVKDTGVNKNAAAVKSAQDLIQKSVKCIVAAQRMLPGASDEMIELQAGDLMALSENQITSTLLRQEELAKSVSKEASKAAKKAKSDDEEVESKKKEEVESSKKKEDEGEEEGVEAAKKKEEDEEGVEAAKAKKEDEEGVEAAKAKKEDEGEEEGVEAAKAKKEEKGEEDKDDAMDMLSKMASDFQAAVKSLKAGKIPEGLKKFQEMKKKEEKAATGKKEEVEAKKEDDAEEAEAKKEEVESSKKKEDEAKEEGIEAAKKEEKKEDGEEGMEAEPESKDASSLLDDIFDSVTPTQKKAGAKSLSGLVKKASTGNNVEDLSSLWNAPPDVSGNF